MLTPKGRQVNKFLFLQIPKETIRKVETQASSKPYESPTPRSKAQKIHLAQRLKSDELDNKLLNVSIQDYQVTWKVTNPLYGDLETLFQDEDFP